MHRPFNKVENKKLAHEIKKCKKLQLSETDVGYFFFNFNLQIKAKIFLLRGWITAVRSNFIYNVNFQTHHLTRYKIIKMFCIRHSKVIWNTIMHHALNNFTLNKSYEIFFFQVPAINKHGDTNSTSERSTESFV